MPSDKLRLVNLARPGKLDREFMCAAFKGLRLLIGDVGERFTGKSMPLDTSFCGVCIAVPKDEEALEQLCRYVRELSVRSLRVDLTYGMDLEMVDTLLDRMHALDTRVLLHLVQPRSLAKQMPAAGVLEQWRAFVADSLERTADRIEAVEIGATVNRAKWAGYNLAGLLALWEVACSEARRSGVLLVGPNVTDFEPQYNAGLLRMLKRREQLPDVHSNNLFAERAIEPEAMDRKILGERFKRLHGYDLIKKAQLVAALGAECGLPRAWSTCAFWTVPRIKRVLTKSENKMADYLVRYFVLCAASGAFERIYWGPLVSRREGLVDDGTGLAEDRTVRDVVSLYRELPGESQQWRVRPAFYALQAVNRFLSGARYLGKLSQGEALQIHAFEVEEGILHVGWTMNGKLAAISDCYSDDVVAGLKAQWSRDGAELEQVPSVLTESPYYLLWPKDAQPKVLESAEVMERVVVAPLNQGEDYYSVGDATWRGLIRAGSEEHAQLLYDSLRPESIASKPQLANLRKARNAIWTVEDPRDPECSLVVKQPVRIAWHKQILDRSKPSKALRSWNGTSELLRRGIESPAPVAFFEHRDPREMLQNWFVCEHFKTEHSARSFFVRYAAGEERVEGYTFEEFVYRILRYIRRMHRRGVIFRDLSGGNVLVQVLADGKLKFSLIDTARARFQMRRFPLKARVSDLKRLCSKLDTERQAYFMNAYLKQEGARFTQLQRWSFKLYALKAQLKRWKRKLRKQFMR